MEVNEAAGFKIWGVDDVVYGPVELTTLVDWIRDERVTAETWIYNMENDAWQKASRVQELQMLFRRALAANSAPSAALGGMKLGALRRVKILADLNEQQLERFVQFMEVQPARQWQEIVKQGEVGDAMYLVLEGELRVRMMIAGKETILTTLNAGEFFGEIALFDQGPRSADVVANKDSLLLKITASGFEKLVTEAPELAAPFVYSIGKTLAARIRADNKRYKDQIHWSRTANASQTAA
jgi:hypothetical protein